MVLSLVMLGVSPLVNVLAEILLGLLLDDTVAGIWPMLDECGLPPSVVLVLIGPLPILLLPM